MIELSGKVIKKNQIIAPFLGARLSFIQGQDPMGMLNVGEQVFSMILPGLNNVTERIRYYSFYYGFLELMLNGMEVKILKSKESFLEELNICSLLRKI